MTKSVFVKIFSLECMNLMIWCKVGCRKIIAYADIVLKMTFKMEEKYNFSLIIVKQAVSACFAFHWQRFAWRALNLCIVIAKLIGLKVIRTYCAQHAIPNSSELIFVFIFYWKGGEGYWYFVLYIWLAAKTQQLEILTKQTVRVLSEGKVSQQDIMFSAKTLGLLNVVHWAPVEVLQVSWEDSGCTNIGGLYLFISVVKLNNSKEIPAQCAMPSMAASRKKGRCIYRAKCPNIIFYILCQLTRAWQCLVYILSEWVGVPT